MAREIEFSFTPTLADYLLFQRVAQRRQLRFVRLLGAILLIVFVILPLAPDADHRSVIARYCDSASALIIPALAFLFFPVANYVSARKRWTAATELQETRTFRISETEIMIRGASFNSSTSWENIRSAETAGQLLFLKTAQRLYYFIPLTAIGDTQKVDELKSLLRRKVKDCKRLR